MKIVITIVAVLVFLLAGVQQPKQAHAGAGDAILLLAVIGGAAYAGYHFSQGYEVKKKAAVEIEGGKLKFERPDIHIETSEKSPRADGGDRYSLALLNLNF